MSRAPITIRAYLLALVVALFVPTLIFASLLQWTVYQIGVEQHERDAHEQTQRLTAIIDGEISASLRAIQGLSTSRMIDNGSWQAFHEQAVAVRAIIGADIVVKDLQGQQLVSTRLPFGATLPQALTDADKAALATRMPALSDLYTGTNSGLPMVSWNVPVVRDGRVIALIDSVVDTEKLSRLLGGPELPANWTAGLIDRNGTIIGRSRRAEQFFGTSATSDLKARATGASGVWTGLTADGQAVLAAYTRSSVTGWRIAVGVPMTVVRAPLWRAMRAYALISAIGLVLSLALANFLAGRLARWTGSLATAAAALGKEQYFDAPTIPIVELERLSSVLKFSSQELGAARRDLELKVAERTEELVAVNAKLVAEIEHRERAEENLRHAQKLEAIGQLTGGIAHDFNNMLAIVLGSLRMLERKLGRGETDVARYVDGARQGAERAAKLTAQLLAFSRRQPLAPQSIDANKLISGLSELVRRTIPETITIETVLAGGLWRAHADPNQLETVLLNLVSNARDAMPNGGKLTIETANTYLDDAYTSAEIDIRSGQYVLVAVTDTGSGMSSEVLQRAFEPFFTTKETGKGTGLGLAQVYGFAKQSNGHVKIYSEPGHGLTIKLYLPRNRDEADTTAQPVKSTITLARNDELILVVEDDDEVRSVTTALLTELGYLTLEASSGELALKLVDTRPDIRLILTDVVMPGMDGRRLAEAAKLRRPDLPVLFTSGYTQNAIVHNGTLDPGVELLMKPFSIEALSLKVERVLNAKRPSD